MAKTTRTTPNRHTRRATLAADRDIPVYVDPQFVRVFADQALVMFPGRDVDLAFLTVGPTVRAVSPNRHDPATQTVHMKPSFHEVARVRIAPAAAAYMAMTILQRLTESGFINKTEMLKNIESFEEPITPGEDEEQVDAT